MPRIVEVERRQATGFTPASALAIAARLAASKTVERIAARPAIAAVQLRAAVSPRRAISVSMNGSIPVATSIGSISILIRERAPTLRWESLTLALGDLPKVILSRFF